MSFPSLQSFGHDLRLLATDGAFVPIPTCAEILLLAAQDLLQSTHIGPRRGGTGKGEGDEGVKRKMRSKWGRGRAGEAECGGV